jgi:hypothetical protein
MWFKRAIAALGLLALSATAALAQGTQFPAGTVWGNDTASQRPGKAVTITSILDRALGTTADVIALRGASAWVATAIPNCPSGVLQYATGTHLFSCAATATAANLEAGASGKVLTADIIYDAEVTLTHSLTPTWDFSTFLNARVTLTSTPITSLTCTNIKASQSGVITLVQDAGGSKVMVAGWCSQFRWANGTRGVLSTAGSAVDALFYQCISTTICYVSLGKAQAN